MCGTGADTGPGVRPTLEATRRASTPFVSADGEVSRLRRDDFSSNRHPALGYWWSMIVSENRFTFFGIMLQRASQRRSVAMRELARQIARDRAMIDLLHVIDAGKDHCGVELAAQNID